MSFRARLITAFAGLAIILALLFTVLSDSLLRNGLEGEANERLALVASLFTAKLDRTLWPPVEMDTRKEIKLQAALTAFAEEHQLHSVVLLLAGGKALDSRGSESVLFNDDYTLSDGVMLPKNVKGTLRVSAPLFQDEDAKWVKTFYVKLLPEQDVWLRLEAGTRLLGAVAKLRKRLLLVALALGAPALLAGIFLAWTLSRRTRQLQEKLVGSPRELSLAGSDEFASVGQSMDRVLRALESERKEKEALLQAKLSQAKSLSWGVAHELRNPLGGLSLLGELMQRKMKEGAAHSEIDELVLRMKDEISRMEGTVATFLDFARVPELKIVDLDYRDIVKNIANGRKPQPQLELIQKNILADAKAFEIIVSVLVDNALEAAGEHGEIKLTTDVREQNLYLSVWDSGSVVAEEKRSKIFNPFVTTKAKGLGLGLANAVSLADAMAGGLNLDNDGKTFVLSLPLVKTVNI